ncbi:MAG: hypothetical protein ACE5QF_02420 [Thermoplasmata archaeon]
MNRRAQLAITDAIIFLLLISLSLGISLVSSSDGPGSAELFSMADEKDYAEETFIVLLRSTLDLQDCGMNHSRLSVDKYILLRTALEDSNEDVEPLAACDDVIIRFARDLILDRYEFRLTSNYVNSSTGFVTEILLSEPERVVPTEYIQISWNFTMICFGKPGDAIMSLVLWRT